MHMMRRLSLLGALSAAALLAACSSSDPGPFGAGGTPGSACLAFAQGQPVVAGIYVLDNTGTEAATVNSVTLSNAHGLTMTKAWLVPVGGSGNGHLLVGAGWPYPPSFTKLVRSVWAQRRPADGATIQPGHTLNLVFGLTRTTVQPGTGDPVISYTAGGSGYTVAEKTTLEVAAKC